MAHISAPEEYTLSNGIPVIFQNYDGPVAAMYWWIQTGSADERPKEAGFAHFLEHMHFKDTDAKSSGRASSGELARAIESFGGDVNAYTSFDQTVYHVTCAAHHWEKVLSVFSTIAKPQKFLRQDFEREREVILEELKKNEDSPGRMLFQHLFGETFAKHPYGRPVIGYVKTLKAAKVADLEAFYRRQYVSGNMGLVLVGPYDEARRKAILGLLEKFYGAKVIKKKPAYRERRAAEPELRTAIAAKKVPFDVKTPSLVFSFRVPSLDHDDLPALDLAASVLGMGEMSRLYQRLFYGASLVTEVGAGLYVPKDPGMLYFNVDVETLEQVRPAYEAVLAELDRMEKEPPTDEELARVVVNSESEKYYAQQTADGIAGRLGFLKFQLGDLTHDQRYLERLKSLDGRTVAQTMRKYLDPRRMAVTLLLPKDAAYDLKPLAERAREALPRTEAEKPAKVGGKKAAKAKAESLPELITLSSGARVLYRERPGSHVMSIHSAALGGLRLEVADPVSTAERDLGSSGFLSAIWAKGTSGKTSQQLAAFVEGKAASLDGYAGRNTAGLQGVGLARDWPELSRLFTEVLLDPVFPKTEVDLTRKVTEDAIRSIEDHSSSLCSKLFLETLYERHPYGKNPQGTLESVGTIDTAKLAAFHRKWLRPERLTLSVVGNVWRKSLDHWLRDLDDRLGAFARATGGSASLPVVAQEEDLKGPRWVERKLGREQVHLLIGGLGLRFDSTERFAMRILQNILGGQSGRLFIELREKKSLAYSVAPISVEGIERGYVATYIASSVEKKEQAIAGIRQVLEELAKKGPTEKEMARAKEFYLGRRAMDLQSDSSLASYYSLESVYNLPIRTEEEIIRRIEAVTAKEVKEVCRKYFVDPHQVTAAVG